MIMYPDYVRKITEIFRRENSEKVNKYLFVEKKRIILFY